MSRTAVVILNYNGEKLLRDFLPSVVQHSPQAEVIVADNGSTDGSLAVLEQSFPNLRVIRLDQNYGFCGGYNRALQQVDADYYVLLNSDVEVTSGWLAPLIATLDNQPEAAAIQPKVLAWAHKDLFEYAGAGGGFIDFLGYPFCRGRIFKTVETDNQQYNDIRQIFWATGACLMIRREAYHRFGGLDEDLFAHMEEIDLCWKLQRANTQVWYNGQSTVYHVGAGTLGYESPRKTYLNFRNNLILLYKHLAWHEFILVMLCRGVLDWVAAFTFLLQGQANNFTAVLRAHLDFIKRLPQTHKKRNALQKAYPSYSKKTIYSRSILLQYYALGRKHFSSLPDTQNYT